MRARGQSHAEAIELLGTVAPAGADMAKDLRRLLDRKDDSCYGLAFAATAEATRMVGWAKRRLGRTPKAVPA